jgi:agmatinase
MEGIIDYEKINNLPPNSYVIWGIPYDIAGGFSGAKDGPNKIRLSLSNYLNKITKHKEQDQYNLYDFDLKKIYDINNLSFTDIGDVSYDINLPPISIGLDVEKLAHNIFLNNHTAIIIGGDHSFTYHTVKAALEKHKKINLIQFDAHHDVYLNNEHQKSALSHGNFIAELLKTNCINLYQYGLRGIGFLSEESLSFLKKRKKGYSSIDVLQGNPIDIFSEIDKNSPCYISIDADVISPSFVPNVGSPAIGGIDYYTILNLLNYLIANFTIIGFDFMELCDFKHNSNIDEGAEIFAKLILNVLLSKLPSKELDI